MEHVSLDFKGKKLVLESGEVAKQASGSVVLRYGDLTILSTTVGVKKSNMDLDFFPLTVNYNEKYYAGGKIPGGFLKREGRPRDKETLISRLIDRPLRPLFPDGLRNEVQIVPTVLSSAADEPSDVFALLAASASTVISWVPFESPVASVRIGLIDGEFIVNPTFSQIEESDLDIMIACSKDAILMIEGEAREVDEDTFIRAIELGHKECLPLIEIQEELAKKLSVVKEEVELFKVDEDLKAKVWQYAEEKMKVASSNADKMKRNESIDAVYDETKKHFIEEEGVDEALSSHISQILHDIEEEVVRKEIVLHNSRPDGRKFEEIRPLSAKINYLPRVHGSALFTRGQTQALAIATLGSDKDAQLIDDMEGKTDKEFMLHYNFPPFSVGEAGRMGSPGRREIGHGNLAERAFNAVRPPKESLPYTIRVVSEILESNGSSSMASVCAASMALLNAGIPLKSNVAGIAMGLIVWDGQHKVLTDIQGVEDHLGDMDFKVAGTEEGITAFQLDIKIKGISTAILSEALEQARKARLEILSVLNNTISVAGELPAEAPKYHTLKVHSDKIKDLIGPGGRNIKGIVEETGSDVNIEDDGTVRIFAKDTEALNQTLALIDSYTQMPEVGKIYKGRITGMKDFGFFVEILPGTEGMCHISELEYSRVENIEDYHLGVGDEIEVKVFDMRNGKIDLSHKQTKEPPEGYDAEAEAKRREGRRSTGGDRGDRGDRRGGRGSDRGDRRGPRR